MIFTFGGRGVGRPGIEVAQSALSQLAASLDGGADSDYPAGHMEDSLAWIAGAQGLLDWAALFHHDSTRSELQAFGKVNDSAGRHMRHYMFDEDAETWRNVADNPIAPLPLGHPYYSHTLDTTTGDLYFLEWAEEFLHRYTRSTDAWDYETATAVSGTDWGSPPLAIAFHPTLFSAKTDRRAVFVWGRGRMHAYSLEDEDATQMALLGDHDDPAPCVYSTALDALVYTGANANHNAYIAEPGDPPTYTQIAGVPVNLAANGNVSLLTVHPSSGLPMILERSLGGGSQVWVYDSGNDEWDLQLYSHPFGSITPGSDQWIVCSMAAYGVVAALYGKGTGAHGYDVGFHVWKPPS